MTLRPLAVAVALVLGSCKSLDVPNYTGASIDLLEQNPTPSVINSMAIGMLIGIRGLATGLETLDLYGRNAFNLDPTEVRSMTTPMLGPLTSGGWWGYRNIRNGNSILKALGVVGAAMTDQQKEGVRGFVKTIMAWEFHALLRVRFQDGAAIDVDRPRSELAPIVGGSQVLSHIVKLLDEAKTHLQAAGTAFSFAPLPSGFTGFNTPATFLRFNRALKARVEVYGATWETANAAAHWNAALQAITESFISTSGCTGSISAACLTTLGVGPQHTYSTASGDALNTLYDPTGRQRLVSPSFLADAERRPNGAYDDRQVRKVIQSTPRALVGYTSDYRWALVPTNTTGIPIIRNEELILLRAEANLGLGNTSAAIQDINFIRANSGGLASISDPFVPAAGQQPTLLDQLLYEKRYSLVYEFGHRWVDALRYNKLASLPKIQPLERLWLRLPFPEDECAQRTDQNLSGCKQEAGI
ncbi:MAG: RagB/SusD family nutrient uptake outer membrane protein [Gemmatimonadetes bacterium]|nr:RagB/SusD family nutrient uptake outer membrane protein [Gemmatimonadota bacterium]